MADSKLPFTFLKAPPVQSEGKLLRTRMIQNAQNRKHNGTTHEEGMHSTGAQKIRRKWCRVSWARHPVITSEFVLRQSWGDRSSCLQDVFEKLVRLAGNNPIVFPVRKNGGTGEVAVTSRKLTGIIFFPSRSSFYLCTSVQSRF
jgi:hypothetical protein